MIITTIEACTGAIEIVGYEVAYWLWNMETEKPIQHSLVQNTVIRFAYVQECSNVSFYAPQIN
jgi:hypothetical protein